MSNSIQPIRIYAVREEVKPTAATEGSAAIDLRVNLSEREPYVVLTPGETRHFTSGLFVEIPVGWCGLVIPRSGLGRQGLHIANVTGLIDADYRGEIGLTLTNNGTDDIIINRFERVCQMVVVPHYSHCYEFVESQEELSDTERGAGGYGHSGKE